MGDVQMKRAAVARERVTKPRVYSISDRCLKVRCSEGVGIIATATAAAVLSCLCYSD